MVFRLMIDGDGAHLQYLAFGGRRVREEKKGAYFYLLWRWGLDS